MLDIIIPTYKNVIGLQQTLNSLGTNHLDKISITVVDDASRFNYQYIQEQYPYVRFVYLNENGGPGIARQKGIEVTHEPWIYFLDCGDTVCNFDTMLKDIEANPKMLMGNWLYVIYTGGIRSHDAEQTAGYVYARKLIEDNHITFCAESSFANEDFGFIRLCWLHMKHQNLMDKYLHFDYVILHEDKNENSLTRRNKHRFYYTECVKGESINTAHILKCAENAGISKELIEEELKHDTNKILDAFCFTRSYAPYFLPIVRKDLARFYHKTYLKYLPANREIARLIGE